MDVHGVVMRFFTTADLKLDWFKEKPTGNNAFNF